MLNTWAGSLGLTDKWMGIRHFKKGYTPQPFHRKIKQGKHVIMHERAEKCAHHQYKEQWGKKTTRTTFV